MRRSDCQHKPHVEQLSVRPICSGHTRAPTGFCRTLSMVTVERSGNGPLENRMANLDHPPSRASDRSASAIASSTLPVFLGMPLIPREHRDGA
jgi:hypothetical protein